MTMLIEQKQRISESLTGRKLSKKHKDNIRKAAKKRKHTEETKRKISEALKKAWKKKRNLST